MKACRNQRDYRVFLCVIFSDVTADPQFMTYAFSNLILIYVMLFLKIYFEKILSIEKL